MNALPITDVRLTAAGPAHRARGFIGYLAFRLGPLLVDGVTLRRSSSHEWWLRFPSRTDTTGRRHAIVRPVDDDARAAITGAILQALGLAEEASP